MLLLEIIVNLQETPFFRVLFCLGFLNVCIKYSWSGKKTVHYLRQNFPWMELSFRTHSCSHFSISCTNYETWRVKVRFCSLMSLKLRATALTLNSVTLSYTSQTEVRKWFQILTWLENASIAGIKLFLNQRILVVFLSELLSSNNNRSHSLDKRRFMKLSSFF